MATDNVSQVIAEAILTQDDIRVSQVVAEAITAFREIRVSQVVAEVVTSYTEIAPEVGQSFGPLVWVEWDASDGTVRVWAPVDLPDPAIYYHGYKSPRLLSAGRVVRALSDEQGEYQGQTFDVTVDDTSRDLRTLLGASDGRRHFLNTRGVMRMISQDDWRAKRVPRTVAIGQARNYRLH